MGQETLVIQDGDAVRILHVAKQGPRGVPVIPVWTEIAGESLVAAAGGNYIANSDDEIVVITLPLISVVGDILRVAGKGEGGWRIEQNAGQSIHFGNDTTPVGVNGWINSTGPFHSITLLCVEADLRWTVLESTIQSDPIPPTPPVLDPVTLASPTSLLIERSNSTDNVEVVNYQYQLNGGAWIDYGLDNPFEIEGLTTGQNYAVRVRAEDDAGNYSAISNVESGTPVIDDAQAFLDAAGIVDPTISNAIIQLVADLKTANLWAKMTAIYPFVGGSANTHKFNLKDPQDTDAALRITWVGGVTHNANGISTDGATGYGNTHITGANLTSNDTHGAIYSRTNYNAATRYDFGVVSPGSAQVLSVIGRRPTGGTQCNNGSFATILNALVANSLGLFVTSRISPTNHTVSKNGVPVGQNAGNEAALVSDIAIPIFIGCVNQEGAPGSFSPKNHAFASFGLGLNDVEALTYYNVVQAFQTALTRQV